jgi:zinc/manganese transport system permease protein
MDVLAHVIDPAMFAQQYMQNALLTGTIVALLSGLVGVFVVLRGVSFAAHSLAQMGFAGAAGVVLVGADPLWGLVAFAVGGAVGLGVLGTRAQRRDQEQRRRDVAAMGTGALFLTLNSAYASAAFSLLFGTILDVSRTQV